MSNKSFETSNNPLEAHAMSEAATLGEMHRLVRCAAMPAQPGETAKAAIFRAARNLGIGFERAKAHWYGLARSCPAHELLAARERVAKAEMQADVEAARRLAQRMAEDQADDAAWATAFAATEGRIAALRVALRDLGA